MTTHVYPLNDWIDHKVDDVASECNCLCEPRVEYLDDRGLPLSEPVVIHNAIDQREKYERFQLIASE